MSRLSQDKYIQMKMASRDLFENCYTAQVHYKQMETVYQEAIERHEK